MSKAFKERTAIKTLHVHFGCDKFYTYTVGLEGVLFIEYSAGTSGTEYSVSFADESIQYRGNLGYEAIWQRRAV